MSRDPLRPCLLCGAVPDPPYEIGGAWRVRCDACGASADGADEDAARHAWAELQAPRPRPLPPALELLESIEAAMCDLEAIRQVPGAMTAWRRWMDDLAELRRIVEEAER